MRERAWRVAGPGAGEKVGILLHRVLDLSRLLQAIEEVGAPAIGRRTAADQDAGRAQALKALDVRAAVGLATRDVVRGRRDGHVEDVHAGQPTTWYCEPSGAF